MIIFRDNCKSKYISSERFGAGESVSYWYNTIIIDQSKDKLIQSQIEMDSQDESRKKFNAFRETCILKPNVYEKQDSMKKVYLREKTSDYSKKYDSLPVKTRIEEYRQGERRIILDSFSKPKLRDY
jgi:hypothetical protein